MSISSIETAKHYIWGGNCDGWHLAASPNLSVIQERVPPGSSETRHKHNKAEQFFYVLQGEAILEVSGSNYTLTQCQGFHVPAGTPHTLSNTSQSDVIFLVISTPPSHGDRDNA